MRIPVVESSQQKIIHIEKLMITKALPIPVVTPFSYISGHQALSLPFILFDLAVALSRRSRTSRIYKTIRFKEFVKAVLLLAGTAFIVENVYFFSIINVNLKGRFRFFPGCVLPVILL